VGLLRQTRRRSSSEEWVSLSGADPLNLIGILTPGPRLASLTDNRLIYRDGLPVATLTAGKTQLLADLDARTRWEAEKRLIRSAARGSLAHLG
jgi:ATP-dependent Lhr-like helicase